MPYIGDIGGIYFYPGLEGYTNTHFGNSGFLNWSVYIFPILGFTINVLSLLGLVLAIGIVVDDAIVVVEAVQVNIAKGMKAKEATLDAMAKVTAPVIATTLVLVAVFIPVAGMAGITGLLYQQFAITIVVSVLVSSVNALTLSPALCSLLLKKPVPYGGPLGWFFKKFNSGMDKSTDAYMSMTNIIGRKIKRGVVFILLMTVGAGVFGGLVPGGFIPEEDMGYFYVNIQLPNAASLQRTGAISEEIEKILMEYPEVQFVLMQRVTVCLLVRIFQTMVLCLSHFVIGQKETLP